MSDLKNCPFCGSEAKLTGECDMVWIKCSNYDCQAERINKFDEPEEAIEDWNRRADVKHGEWERIENPYGELEAFSCECGYFGQAAYNYCPSCGSKMSGGEAKGRKEIKYDR